MATQLSVRELQTLVDKYVTERDWKRYHKPKDVAISMAIESSELLELFQWKPDPSESGQLNDELKSRIGEELADVLIYGVCLANSAGIDLSDALLDKIQKNREKYPVKKVSGAKNWDEVRSLRHKRFEKNRDG